MSSHLKRYEAAVKLRDGKVVQYHNINTGLFKFHRFILSKFGQDGFRNYTVRRIETKEVIGSFSGGLKKTDVCRKIFGDPKPNVGNTGVWIDVAFGNGDYEINRGLFFSYKIVFEQGDDYIIIPNDIYMTAIEQAKNDLADFYNKKGMKVSSSDFDLIEEAEMLTFERELIKSTEPFEDYP
ncbi:hypothetical protein ACT4R0_09715 [Ornithobacterium rhinotracheale]|uniref:hypothetical protein n=1 Tax=Ornithobacterium rhinotracheale TaxID=28251 RepID=UPI004036774A